MNNASGRDGRRKHTSGITRRTDKRNLNTRRNITKHIRKNAQPTKRSVGRKGRTMTNTIKREITKEQYDRVINDHDARGIFTEREVMGYGVYDTKYTEEDGKYFVSFCLGSSCD